MSEIFLFTHQRSRFMLFSLVLVVSNVSLWDTTRNHSNHAVFASLNTIPVHRLRLPRGIST
ncbi:hypothetical protein P9112_013040 [Eukaryota sp. TZLM1-RC]